MEIQQTDVTLVSAPRPFIWSIFCIIMVKNHHGDGKFHDGNGKIQLPKLTVNIVATVMVYTPM